MGTAKRTMRPLRWGPFASPETEISNRPIKVLGMLVQILPKLFIYIYISMKIKFRNNSKVFKQVLCF